MAVWEGYIGIFDSSCGTFTTPSYDPGLIDVSTKTFGTHYIILNILTSQEPASPDVNIKKLPKRLNMSTGMGKNDLTVTLNGSVTRRESGSKKGSAILKYNLIKKFMDLHDELNDDSIYLVQRERNADDDEWDYAEYEDITSPIHNFDVEFLKGKIAGLNKKYQTYGYIEYTLQFQEAWY